MKRGRNQRRRQGTNPNRALDSNGPEVRIRGTANQVYDKYIALARDASSAGDRVKAENYFQHAEHYFRLIRSMQPAQPPRPANGEGGGEQPGVDDREGRAGERRAEQSRPNGGAEASETGDKTEAPAETPVAAAEAPAADGAAGDAEAEKKPRRRRARRPAKSAETTDAEPEAIEPESTAAAAE